MVKTHLSLKMLSDASMVLLKNANIFKQIPVNFEQFSILCEAQYALIFEQYINAIYMIESTEMNQKHLNICENNLFLAYIESDAICANLVENVRNLVKNDPQNAPVSDILLPSRAHFNAFIEQLVKTIKEEGFYTYVEKTSKAASMLTMYDVHIVAYMWIYALIREKFVF